MSYYDHGVMMAFRLGPWASRPTTGVDLDIEHAAMLQQRFDQPPSARGAVPRMFERLANRWNPGTRRRRPNDQETGDTPPKPR